ncbi:MAG: hypothetical protein AB3N22_08760 [Ruegeria sp.]
MSHHSQQFRHRIAAFLVWCLSLPAAAHDGPHAARLLVSVVSAQQSGDRVDVALALTGLDTPMVLQSLVAAGAETVHLAPVSVGFAQDVAVVSTLEFAGAVPGLFTLVLEFEGGVQGAVVVIPEQNGPTDEGAYQ